jgi:hypothetical protein
MSSLASKGLTTVKSCLVLVSFPNLQAYVLCGVCFFSLADFCYPSNNIINKVMSYISHILWSLLCATYTREILFDASDLSIGERPGPIEKRTSRLPYLKISKCDLPKKIKMFETKLNLT